MNINDTYDGIVTSLTAAGWRCLPEIPSQANPPQVVLGFGAGEYEDMNQSIGFDLPVTLVVSTASARTAQRALKDACSNEGSGALQPDLDAAGVEVNGWDEPVVMTIGSVDYIAVTFNCRVTG